MMRPPPGAAVSPAARALAPWFHNLHLPDGSQTAPKHPLGDFPACKWRQIAPHLPKNLRGWTALDIGCNAGFYTLELARRGATVTALDKDPHFLAQARWAISQFHVEDRVTLRQAQVYDLARESARYDLVLFLGVFYHLRYPLLALDAVVEKVKRLLVFQTLTLPGERQQTASDLRLDERRALLRPGWPKMAFIENALAGDPTNWWAANHACVMAMLRSTGMKSIRRVGHEIYLCRPPVAGLAKTRKWDEGDLGAAVGRHAIGAKAGTS